MRSCSPISRTTRAGTPIATTPAGRSRVTTAPAPTTVSLPIVTPGQTMTPPASQTLSAMVIGCRAIHPPHPAVLGIDGMGRGQQLHPRGDLTGGADGDRRDVEHHGVDVDERPLA